jgi:isopentenyl-diphosphate Delta-isomerase
MSDLLTICDADGKSTAQLIDRKKVHAKKLLHHSVHIWIVNSKRELLLTQRSFQKSNYPGAYHISAGGHRDADEDPADTTIRELKEELGIDVSKNDLIKLDFRYEPVVVNGKIDDNEWLTMYLVVKDVKLEEIKLDPKEVDRFFLMDIDKFQKQMQKKGFYAKFVQQSQQYYLEITNKIIHYLKKNNKIFGPMAVKIFKQRRKA